MDPKAIRERFPETFNRTRRFVRGDANLDGWVNIADAIATLGFLFEGSGEAKDCADALDSDDSGEINIADPIFTLGFLFLGERAVPPPFPDCGADVTDDELCCRESAQTGCLRAGDPDE